MPLQSFRWNDDALPVVGQTASIGNHGYCTSTVGAETVTRPTGVIRSWRRRVPRSSIILVDVEVPALVQVAEEDRVEAVATPRASPSQVDVPTTMNARTVLLTDFLPDESARPAVRADQSSTIADWPPSNRTSEKRSV